MTIECTDGQVIDLLIGGYGNQMGGGVKLSSYSRKFAFLIRNLEMS